MTIDRQRAALGRIAQKVSPENRWQVIKAAKQTAVAHANVPDIWQERINAMFAPYIPYELSQPHIDFWEWVDEITGESIPRPFVGLWPRGRGKSTHIELAATDLLARGKRLYCLYVSETQEQADKHITTIQHIMESNNVTRFYPDVGQPRISSNGNRSWRRSAMTAANGATAEAIGLDKAVRGQKIDWARPDLIVFDDIDAKHDTEHATNKKQGTITTSILPAGSHHCAVVFMQNLIHNDSIAHRLSKNPGEQGAADYLANRIISGPHKAVEDLEYRFVSAGNGGMRWEITNGRSLWNGFTLDVCETELTRAGPTAFELESQHEIDTDNDFALLSTEIMNATRVSSAPDFIRAAVAVDPSGGAGQCGIIGGGIAKLNGVTHSYVVADRSTPKGTPSSQWAADVLILYLAIKADCVYVERNFGGDMAKTTIQAIKLVKTLDEQFRAALPDDIVFENREQAQKYTGERTAVILVLDGAKVSVKEVTASRGKEVRAEPVAAVYQQGKAHHVGFLPDLQKQWTQWIPGTKPSPDRLDADVWLQHGLGIVDITEAASWADVQGLGTIETANNWR